MKRKITVKIHFKFEYLKGGSVYFVVKTALGTYTGRKRRTVVKKLCLTCPDQKAAKRPRTPNNLIKGALIKGTPNKPTPVNSCLNINLFPTPFNFVHTKVAPPFSLISLSILSVS